MRGRGIGVERGVAKAGRQESTNHQGRKPRAESKTKPRVLKDRRRAAELEVRPARLAFRFSSRFGREERVDEARASGGPSTPRPRPLNKAPLLFPQLVGCLQGPR